MVVRRRMADAAPHDRPSPSSHSCRKQPAIGRAMRLRRARARASPSPPVAPFKAGQCSETFAKLGVAKQVWIGAEDDISRWIPGSLSDPRVKHKHNKINPPGKKRILGLDVENRAKFLEFDSAQRNSQSRKQGMHQRP